MNFNDNKRDVAEGTAFARWTLFRVFSCFVVPAAILLAVCAFLLRAWNTASGVADRVASPDAIVGNYEWYEQQVKDIKAMEGQIKDAEAALEQFKKDNGPSKEWAFDQRQEQQRLAANAVGLKQARRKLIEDYNARASMMTRNLWKHPSLPYHIEEN